MQFYNSNIINNSINVCTRLTGSDSYQSIQIRPLAKNVLHTRNLLGWQISWSITMAQPHSHIQIPEKFSTVLYDNCCYMSHHYSDIIRIKCIMIRRIPYTSDSGITFTPILWCLQTVRLVQGGFQYKAGASSTYKA